MHAVKNLTEAFALFLEKVPHGIDVGEIQEHLCQIDGVMNVHHIHVWSMDGQNHYATMHIVADGDTEKIKQAVRGELLEHGIAHATLELERAGEDCREVQCQIDVKHPSGHHHHHH